MGDWCNCIECVGEFLEYRDWVGGEVSWQVNEFAAVALQAAGGVAGRW